MIETGNLCVGCFGKLGTGMECSSCMYDERAERSPLFLPHRTLLRGRYLIGRSLGNPGGFGITYVAWDMATETKVAIKEYLPREIAGRSHNGTTVQPHTESDSDDFRYGLEQFLAEAKALSLFDHPNIVRIRDFFEENLTAYLVMEYVEGISLWEFLKQSQGKIPEKRALELMMPILDGLRAIHAKGFLHRDLKPQNIYVCADGRTILLDFGAARFAAGERSRSLSVVLTPGFAPFEQHRRRGYQGPWTDIYGVAATLYHSTTGVVPPDATAREEYDELRPLRFHTSDISYAFSSAVLMALSRNPEERPQTVQEFQEMLSGKGSRARVRGSVIDPGDRPVPSPPPRNRSTPVRREVRAQEGPGRLRSILLFTASAAVLLVCLLYLIRQALPVRVVERSADGRFQRQSDGVVYDARTGLEWLWGSDTDTDRVDAQNWLAEVSKGKPIGWRIPKEGELKGILDTGAATAAKLDPIFGRSMNLDRECLRVWACAERGYTVSETDLLGRATRQPDCGGRLAMRVLGARSRDARQEQSPGTRFELIGDSVISDRLTALDWHPGPNHGFTYNEAMIWIAELNAGGGGWRMPTGEELEGLFWSDRPIKNNFQEAFGQRVDLTGRSVSCDPRILVVWAEPTGYTGFCCFWLRERNTRCDDKQGGSCSLVFAVRPTA